VVAVVVAARADSNSPAPRVIRFTIDPQRNLRLAVRRLTATADEAAAAALAAGG
jgi:hypothetical protein